MWTVPNMFLFLPDEEVSTFICADQSVRKLVHRSQGADTNAGRHKRPTTQRAEGDRSETVKCVQWEDTREETVPQPYLLLSGSVNTCRVEPVAEWEEVTTRDLYEPTTTCMTPLQSSISVRLRHDNILSTNIQTKTLSSSFFLWWNVYGRNINFLQKVWKCCVCWLFLASWQ